MIRKNASTEVISTWSVPPAGYGTNNRPQGLELSASTSALTADIKQLQVQSVDANGWRVRWSRCPCRVAYRIGAGHCHMTGADLSLSGGVPRRAYASPSDSVQSVQVKLTTVTTSTLTACPRTYG
ncbi:hypothetical protein NKG94_23545 [Micromonospora sp. M12]